MFSAQEIVLLVLTIITALAVLHHLSSSSNGCRVELSGHSAVIVGTACEAISPDLVSALSAHLHGLRF
uniref:Movement protein TGBp3 n=1 Tax=Papaya mosaic potexvirus TaxID=12181 RepID=A0A3G8FWK9_PMV|nr:orf4 [Papaya mosaic virus]